MFTRILMVMSYIFLLVVLLPHTAWMFSLFEPAQSQGLGWAGAIAFELTIGALTHFLARELAAVSDIAGEKFIERMKRELMNIPAFLLLGSILISTVANWTHAYNFANTVPFGDYSIVKVLYSTLFGAALPLCSFAYAYVLSRVYRKDESKQPIESETEAAAWQVIVQHRKQNSGRDLTPRYLARQAGITEETASRVIAEAVQTGVISMNGKQ
jgi:hypothetical protein